MSTGVGGNYRATNPTISAHSVFVVTNEYSAMVLLLIVVAVFCIVMCMICFICCCCYCCKYKKLGGGGGNVAPVSGKGSPQKGGKAAPLKKQDSKAGAKKK